MFAILQHDRELIRGAKIKVNSHHTALQELDVKSISVASNLLHKQSSIYQSAKKLLVNGK